MTARHGGEVRVGISGWVYPEWRGIFYPKGLAQRLELSYASERLSSIEINGTFYSLQKVESFAKWRDETPDDFRFAMKGSRFITHIRRLKEAELPLGNYFASGPLVLGEKMGPVLWQTAPNLPLDLARLEAFLELLPKSTVEAAELARRHHEKVEGEPWTRADVDRPIRHAIEPRHPSYYVPEVVRLLREHGIAFVIADTAGKLPSTDEVTADFVYVRLHGLGPPHADGYGDEELEVWARRIGAWTDEQRDVYAYFDTEAKVRAPFDAMRLLEKLGVTPAAHDAPAAPRAPRAKQARPRTPRSKGKRP